MANVIDVTYQSTGKSLDVDKLGMREMQRKAFQKRNEKYILIKAPPASGKSRALMFIGLDKIYKQKLKKVIVSVPERTIGKSFRKTPLKKDGYFADWDFDDKYDLCTPGDEGKTSLFRSFLEDSSKLKEFSFENSCINFIVLSPIDLLGLFTILSKAKSSFG